jgi:hypothetical protein
VSAGFFRFLHASGSSDAAPRLTIWLRVELVASDTEYGSVTLLCSTLPVDGAKTSTS